MKGIELYRSTIIPRLPKSYKEISKDNNKRDIGEKKFSQKRKALYS